MAMTSKEAIEVIKNNYPDERDTMLREALDLAMSVLAEDAKKEEWYMEHGSQKNNVF